eukprot:1903794-Pleurochrysis_carterae.AAC.2
MRCAAAATSSSVGCSSTGSSGSSLWHFPYRSAAALKPQRRGHGVGRLFAVCTLCCLATMSRIAGAMPSGLSVSSRPRAAASFSCIVEDNESSTGQDFIVQKSPIGLEGSKRSWRSASTRRCSNLTSEIEFLKVTSFAFAAEYSKFLTCKTGCGADGGASRISAHAAAHFSAERASPASSRSLSVLNGPTKPYEGEVKASSAAGAALGVALAATAGLATAASGGGRFGQMVPLTRSDTGTCRMVGLCTSARRSRIDAVVAIFPSRCISGVVNTRGAGGCVFRMLESLTMWSMLELSRSGQEGRVKLAATLSCCWNKLANVPCTL